MKSLSHSFALGPSLERANIAALFADWVKRLSPLTRRAYLEDLKVFAAWCAKEYPKAGGGEEDGYQDCLAFLFSQSGPSANRMVMDFRDALDEEGKSPATVNRRLACLKAIGKFLHASGVVPYTLFIKLLEIIPYRDTKGPGLEAVRKIILAARGLPSPFSIRNETIILSLFTLGLRVSEAVKLDVPDLDIEGKRIRVHGKGRKSPEWVGIPEGFRKKCAEWLKVRDEYALIQNGPFFVNLSPGRDTAYKLERISRGGIFYVIRNLGDRVGLKGLHPHALRHSAITEVLKANGGNLVKAMRFSRHKDPRTVMVYEDNLSNASLEMAAELDRRILSIEGKAGEE